MSRSINRVELLGHLGQDAEVKFTPNGTRVARLSVATSRRWKPEGATEWKEVTEWHRCVLWRCDNLAPFLTKGKQVYIAGRLQTRKWEQDGSTRYATEIICEEIILLGGDRAGSRQNSSSDAAEPPAGDDHQQHGVTEDDVPF